MTSNTIDRGGNIGPWASAVDAVNDKDADRLRTLVATRPGLAQKHDGNGDTLLHLAAWADADQCAEVLLAAGAAIDAVNTKGDMPHHDATMNGCPKTLSLLLSAGAPVDARGWDGTALYARMDDDDTTGFYGLIVQLLLDFGADPNLGEGVGGLAFFLDSQEYVALLLDYGAFISRGDAGGWGENLDNFLLGGSDYYVKDQVMMYLIERGANISSRDGDGRTPLHLVAGASSTVESPEYYASVLQVLIQLGADASAVDSGGRTALDMARSRDEMPEIEAILIEAARDAETPWRRTWHALLSADVDRLARTLDAHPELIRSADADGNTLLHLAPHDGGTAIRLLLDRGADIEARNAAGETPLFNAVRRDRTDMVLDAHKSATKSSNDVLTTAGASLHARSKGGVTPLHVAAEFSRTRFLRSHLAEDGCFRSDTAREGLSAQDDAGRTLLHHAACAAPRSVRRIATMNMLVRAGANPDLPDKEGDSPVALAWRSYPLSEAQRMSLWRLWGDLRDGHVRVEDRDGGGRTALHGAAAGGDILAVQMLLMYGSDIGGRDAEEHTPLDLAMQSGKSAAARYLLNAGAESEKLRPLFFYAPPLLPRAGPTTEELQEIYERLKSQRDGVPRIGDALGDETAQAEVMLDTILANAANRTLEVRDEGDDEDDDSGFPSEEEGKWDGPVIGGRTDGAMWGEHDIETGAEWNGESEDE